jgi:hypothetical protein
MGLAFRPALRAFPLAAVFFLGLLAFTAVERLVGADALLLLGLAARLRAAGRAAALRRAVFFFAFAVFALRAGFLAMESPIRVIRQVMRRDLTERP